MADTIGKFLVRKDEVKPTPKLSDPEQAILDDKAAGKHHPGDAQSLAYAETLVKPAPPGPLTERIRFNSPPLPAVDLSKNKNSPERPHSQDVNMDGGQGGLTTGPLPFVGTIGLQALDTSTLARNAKLEAISLAQQALARNKLMTYAQKAKELFAIARQQTTLLSMGTKAATNLLFPASQEEAYHPVVEKPNPVFLDAEPKNRYGPDYDNSSVTSQPSDLVLSKLNNPADGSTEEKGSKIREVYRTAPRSINTTNIDQTDSKLIKAFTTEKTSFVDATSKREENGYFKARGDVSTLINTLPSDDEVYVPLVFTDLRPLAGNSYRSIYFRPFIKSLSEDFAPEWNMSSYFGRVDSVATYQSTNRTISLSFSVTCFTPEDLQVMYQKLGWLTSLVYPMYDNGLRYKSGPVLRMRVGDVINAVGKDGNRGVPGVITSLNYSYDDSSWELLKDRKLPKNVDVSLGFQVLHEYPVGLMAGAGGASGNNVFGGIDVRHNNFTTSDATAQTRVDVKRFRASFGKDILNNPNVTINRNNG